MMTMCRVPNTHMVDGVPASLLLLRSSLIRFGGYVAIILVGSLAVTAAAGVKCADDNDVTTTCNGPTSYAIAAGAGSLALCSIFSAVHPSCCHARRLRPPEDQKRSGSGC